MKCKFSKKVCEKCWNDHCSISWGKVNDKKWAWGYVYCIIDERVISINDSNDMPKECMYKLEHVVIK